MSTITLIDANRQWFKAKTGLISNETSRSISFCSDAIKSDNLMIVSDAALHHKYKNYSNVTGDPHIRFYAGMPLTTDKGYNIGTLCVIDVKPRILDEEQIFALQVLAKQVMKMMELKLLNKKLGESVRVQEQIISVLAHDIRSPLRSVKHLIEMHKYSVITKEQQEDILALMPTRIQHTLEMIDNLVEWGELQMKQTYNEIEFNLHDLVDNCLQTQQLPADLKNNKLVNNVKHNLMVTADKNSIDFMLRNIVSNAIKFTENGSLEINADYDDEAKLKLSVKDSGVGIDKNKLAVLFDADKKSTTNGTKNEKGNGLGLKLIKESLDKKNGAIEVYSELGKGTRVTVTFSNINP